MKITHINSFDEYVEYIEQFKNKVYFRGQANSLWEVKPSLFRDTCKISLEDERKMVKDEVATSELTPISALFKLQHYGKPTRICDLTVSPFSALFFAVDDEKQFDNDGVVFIIDKTEEIASTSELIDVFSQMLVSEDVELASKLFTRDEIKSAITRNYILQYNYKFSYTNKRAILQGGTGLFFGYSFSGETIKQCTNLGIEEYIKEKIIIPSAIKNKAKELLSQLGYTQDTLYGTFENSSGSIDFDFEETEREITAKASFYKYVAKYKVSGLFFDRDTLIKKIHNKYSELFKNYGRAVRIWLFFYYDDNDISHANWICRTEWRDAKPCSIKWTKDYFQTRLSHINEQASRQEVFGRFNTLLKELIPIYNSIASSVADSAHCLPNVLEVIKKYAVLADKISSTANNIPFCDTKTEKTAELALCFINNVDWLVRDMIIFDDRGDIHDDNKQIFYLLTSLYIRKCEESKNKLDAFYNCYSSL